MHPRAASSTMFFVSAYGLASTKSTKRSLRISTGLRRKITDSTMHTIGSTYALYSALGDRDSATAMKKAMQTPRLSQPELRARAPAHALHVGPEDHRHDEARRRVNDHRMVRIAEKRRTRSSSSCAVLLMA